MVYSYKRIINSAPVSFCIDFSVFVYISTNSIPGATHDAYVWSHCDLKPRFDSGEFGDYLLVGK